MHREMIAMGASETGASVVARNSRRRWRNNRSPLNRMLSIPFFDRLGVPRLS